MFTYRKTVKVTAKRC